MQAEPLYPGRCELGEGPFWYQNRCYWFDILNHELHSCTLDGSDHQTIILPEMFSAAAPLSSGGLLLASETALWRFQGTSESPEKLHALEAGNPLTRSNDGRADRQGGFWIGTMGKQAETGAGAVYRYYQGELTQLLSNITIPNAICFSPAGDFAYFTDTPKRIIQRWKLDAAGWPLGDAEDWVVIDNDRASPDGAVVDSEGCLWNAQWGTGQVVRYTPDGKQDQLVQLPVAQTSCPAFVGADYSRMLVTTAREGMDSAQRALQSQAGNTFIMPLAVRGLADGFVQL